MLSKGSCFEMQRAKQHPMPPKTYANGKEHLIDLNGLETAAIEICIEGTKRQQLNQFLQTPIGRMFTTIAFMWFLLSGWLFRIILFSMWVLPLAAPLLISSAARNMIVEGSCPSCKRRFIGNRNQMVICNYCKAVVWQPRQDYSKGQSDPTIIDVDID
ncbi:hypothetical protein L7F22_057703 [Adiantum nelumboides]|nr:hypothetical protein [Adiantum nelumboides]